MKLVVAEKPSVMRDIAAVLGANQTNADGALCGNGYMVAAARGHLLRNKTPDEYVHIDALIAIHLLRSNIRQAPVKR